LTQCTRGLGDLIAVLVSFVVVIQDGALITYGAFGAKKLVLTIQIWLDF